MVSVVPDVAEGPATRGQEEKQEEKREEKGLGRSPRPWVVAPAEGAGHGEASGLRAARVGPAHPPHQQELGTQGSGGSVSEGAAPQFSLEGPTGHPVLRACFPHARTQRPPPEPAWAGGRRARRRRSGVRWGPWGLPPCRRPSHVRTRGDGPAAAVEPRPPQSGSFSGRREVALVSRPV